MNTGTQWMGDAQAINAGLPRSGTVLWLMGPTSAGKTTLATRVVAHLRQRQIPVVFYDGDEIRAFFGPDFGFSAEERFRVVSVLAHLANKAAEAGLHVVVAAVTAGQEARDFIRANVRNLKIGYISCSIYTCAQRDPKGLYRKAINGEIDTLIGYNGEYRAPNRPDLVLDTERYSVDELASQAVPLFCPK
jgi:adenylylsulfate kinase-like enzyme